MVLQGQWSSKVLSTSFLVFGCWPTDDLSQADKKINVVTSWANAENDKYFTQTNTDVEHLRVVRKEIVANLSLVAAVKNIKFMVCQEEKNAAGTFPSEFEIKSASNNK